MVLLAVLGSSLPLPDSEAVGMKSSRPDMDGIQAEIGSTTPKEREERSSAASAHGWSTCAVCNYKRKGYVEEVEDEYLERCPRCGAYDWRPEPIKVRVEA